MQKVLIALATVAILLVGTGCSSSGPPENGASPTTASAPTDGKRYVVFTEIGIDPDQVTFDAQEYLTGPEAEAAARADGALEDGGSLDGGVYIVNDSTETATLPVTDDVKVTILQRGGGSSAPKVVSFPSFERRFDAEGDPENLRTHGYWIQIGDGQVTSIVEQYQP